ncbi:MAG: hypothetical protein KC620_06655 [Myxococcales bacterium]|nr:hypothetical protein [Myxococcales bacterium]
MSSPAVYIERSLDADSLRTLLDGRNLYVLGPAGGGKSTLRRRLAARLRADGHRCAEIELGRIAEGALTGATWYFALAEAIAAPFGLPDALAFWEQHAELSPQARWSAYLASVPAGSAAVLLVDELESLLARPYPPEEFFGALLAAADGPVHVGLFGATRPDLLLPEPTRPDAPPSPARTWFREAVELAPTDFTAAEVAAAFGPRFAPLGGDVRALAAALIDWTGGQPALTERLAAAIAKGGPLLAPGTEAATVAAQAEAIFDPGQRDRVPTFSAAQRWIDGAPQRRVAALWGALLGGERPTWRPRDPAHCVLLMAGFITVDGVSIRPRGRVFTTVFDAAWVEARLVSDGLPARVEAWLQADRAAELLLHGEALDRACAWADGRTELAPEVRDYLMAGLRGALARRPEALTAPGGLSTRTGQALVVLGVLIAVVGAMGIGALLQWNSEPEGLATSGPDRSGGARSGGVSAAAPAVSSAGEVTDTAGAGGLEVEVLSRKLALAEARIERLTLERNRASAAAARWAHVAQPTRKRARRLPAPEVFAEAPPEPAPGPIAPPPPSVLVARQAPTYARSLKRCNRVGIPQRVKMSLAVGPDGRVREAQFVDGQSDMLDVRCLEASARRFRFAPFEGEAVLATVAYDL